MVPEPEKKQVTAVATRTGAVSHEPIDWKTINWQKANQNVRRLQARIVKATLVQRPMPGRQASDNQSWQENIRNRWHYLADTRAESNGSRRAQGAALSTATA